MKRIVSEEVVRKPIGGHGYICNQKGDFVKNLNSFLMWICCKTDLLGVFPIIRTPWPAK